MEPDDQIGRVYAVRMTAGPVKIGFVSADDRLLRRVRNLQTACPWRLQLLGSKVGTRRNEFELHSGLRNDRMIGEWFAPSENVLIVLSRMFAPDFHFDQDGGTHSHVLWAA